MDTNRTGFRAELEALINRHSKEGGSDTPDFILADYMADCLDAYDKAVTRRTEWYKPEPKESPNVELTGSRAGLSPVSPATEGSEVERRVGAEVKP